MKSCSKCKIEYDLIFFNKDKSSKDGYRSNCKYCSKKYREDNKESILQYKLKNKDKIKEYQKGIVYDPIKKREYYLNNIELIKLKSSVNYLLNKDKKIKYQQEYYKNNRDKIYKYLSDKRENDNLYNLTVNVRNLINNSFYNEGYSKSSKTQEILGCSFIEFKEYLELKFENWMNWENKGIYNGEFNFGWDIDHIIPLSSSISVEDIVKLNHYTNLQPLCSKVNREVKRDKILIEFKK